MFFSFVSVSSSKVNMYVRTDSASRNPVTLPPLLYSVHPKLGISRWLRMNMISLIFLVNIQSDNLWNVTIYFSVLH
jgi:hypothetical protein